MRIGVPTETKPHEYRVAITPAGVAELVRRGHQVLVESGAGLGSSITDDQFAAAGAQLSDDAETIWATADLILKVKDPTEQEQPLLRSGQVLFCYLHLAASRQTTEALLAAGTTAIAYETVQTADGALPRLMPMSEVAGGLAVQTGAYHLMRGGGGRGVLLGGVPGVPPADVVIIGAGTAGAHAARTAAGMGAAVTVFDIDVARLRSLDVALGGRVRTRFSTALDVDDAVRQADLVIGAVLVPGRRAPKLVSNSTVAGMRPGAVVVDVAIDQGGCFEDSRPTTFDDPTYHVHDTVFCCIGNLPGAVPRTSTFALVNATLPYVVRLADHGWRAACVADPALARGLATHFGELFSASVAGDLGLPYSDPATLLG